jgi:hypothetical protein
MNQFYLYDKGEAGAYNRARLKAVPVCPGALLGHRVFFGFFDY